MSIGKVMGISISSFQTAATEGCRFASPQTIRKDIHWLFNLEDDAFCSLFLETLARTKDFFRFSKPLWKHPEICEKLAERLSKLAESQTPEQKEILQAHADAFCNARNARVDPLTGLLNGHYFKEALADCVKPGDGRRSHGDTLLYIDLDGFKAINDGYGHKAGDTLLRAFSVAIKTSVRETDVIARMGGDEFCILIRDTIPNEVKIILGRIDDCLKKPLCHYEGGSPLQVRASIGVWFLREGVDPDKVLTKVDELMYKAKKNAHEVPRPSTVRVRLPFQNNPRPDPAPSPSV